MIGDSQDFNKSQSQQAIQGFDVLHQLYRLRHNKNLPNAEAELIMRAFAENSETYEQVTEVRDLSPMRTCLDMLSGLATIISIAFWWRSPPTQLWPLPPAGNCS